MNKITDWQSISEQSRKNRVPVVIMVDQEDCPYCYRVENEYFAAIFANGELSDQALFGKISIDYGETIVVEGGEAISTREFLDEYNPDFTPTILFLDDKKKELVDKIIGLTTPDFYGYYLEAANREAYKKLNY